MVIRSGGHNNDAMSRSDLRNGQNMYGKLQQQESVISNIQVFDQQEEVLHRGQHIRSIEKDAVIVNSLGKEVNHNIFAQDNKLDGLNKNYETGEKNLKKANEQLLEANEIATGNNKMTCCCLVLLAIVVLIIIITLLFMFNVL